MKDLRAEAARHDALVAERLDRLVPRLLDETGIDCWVLIGREYAEDPVMATMLPATWLSARRRTILVLAPTGRWAIARYPVGDLFAAAWDVDALPDQWRALGALLGDLAPSTIGIGTAKHHAHADGLTVAEHTELMRSLPDHLAERLTSAEALGVRWLETRLPEERADLEAATGMAHGILRRALSRQVIEPGTTTTEDVVWWLRGAVDDACLDSWFHPTVVVQRAGAMSEGPAVISEGDLVHIDFGIVYRSLCTDQQEHAYVLRSGEEAVPSGLAAGMRSANLAQDLLLGEMRLGRTGDEILAATRARCGAAGLDATIYSHPIGLHGHGAGTVIGLWDHQDGVPGTGAHPLHPDTAYAIELMVRQPVPEWGGSTVRFMVEQDAWFDGRAMSWLDGRQEEIWAV